MKESQANKQTSDQENRPASISKAVRPQAVAKFGSRLGKAYYFDGRIGWNFLRKAVSGAAQGGKISVTHSPADSASAISMASWHMHIDIAPRFQPARILL